MVERVLLVMIRLEISGLVSLAFSVNASDLLDVDVELVLLHRDSVGLDLVSDLQVLELVEIRLGE